jgi:uncharacterized protein YjbI with pentapeptide repeats
MSEQENMQATAKLRRNRRTQKQNGTQPPSLPLPANDDKEGWKVYWKAQGQPWRTEPEIDAERQTYLAERHSIVPDIKQGIYPFKDIRLNRADVEWLLAAHEKGRGPVNWGDESQRERDGLDLRGADLSQEDLSDLPLARMYGALALDQWENATEEQRNMAVVCMKGADLRKTQLQGATLRGAQLQAADLRKTQLQEATLYEAQLQGATLRGAQLQAARLRWAQLQAADLREAQLQGADLRRVQLDGVYLKEATLSDEQYGPALLADVRWGEINLAVVDWMPVKMLGDEQVAHQKKYGAEDIFHRGGTKDKQTRIDEYKVAVRANRQLAAVLRDQGLNEEADHFAYRAQVLQRIVFRRQRKFGRYLFLGFLDLLAGYGYRPGRSVFWYLATVCGFALAYHLLGQLSLFPPDAFVYSLTSFHGRGFFPGLEHRTSLHDPLIMLAAIEAVVGLFIEISFIATFTQRFFGR